MATIDLKRFTDNLESNKDNKYGIVYCTNAARLEAMKHEASRAGYAIETLDANSLSELKRPLKKTVIFINKGFLRQGVSLPKEYICFVMQQDPVFDNTLQGGLVGRLCGFDSRL